jgi:RimJ/RimL family protein N-acetyltransferase
MAPLADPGTLLSTTHEVDHGLRVRLRLARPSDAMRMRAFFDDLSDETRHRRFFVATPHTSETLIRHFTFFNPRERLVVVAVAMIAHTEEIVGVADVALLDTAVAELGVVVHDAHQGSGIGKLLTEAIASLALRQGATHLRAELLEGNRRMVALMQRLGSTVVTAEGQTSAVVTRLPVARRRAA